MTYSLIAYDSKTGQLGSLIASRWTAVGSCVPYFRQGVGLIHTQHCANPLLAHHSLTAIQEGMSVEESLQTSLSKDSNKEFRQCVIADMSGNLAAYSGSKVEAICTDAITTNVAAAGNMLVSEDASYQ